MTPRRAFLTAVLAAGAATAAQPALALQARAQPRQPVRQTLTREQAAIVGQASAYFQGLSAVRGRFTETGPRGETRSGAFYLQRPGRARFEYDAPSRLLVVSDGSNVKRYDPRLNTFQQAPLSATPLSVFHGRNVRIDEGVRIDRAVRTREGFEIVARDARRLNEGSIALVFGGSPARLMGWTITDAQGGRTRVQLTSMAPASGLAASLFQLRDPTRRPGRR